MLDNLIGCGAHKQKRLRETNKHEHSRVYPKWNTNIKLLSQ